MFHEFFTFLKCFKCARNRQIANYFKNASCKLSLDISVSPVLSQNLVDARRTQNNWM